MKAILIAGGIIIALIIYIALCLTIITILLQKNDKDITDIER